MGFQQDTIIYIDEQDKLDASAAANAFADKNVKNRAYVNTLGAELAMKYLASENISVDDIYNIHSIKKILEELDISDVMLPNIHIDVRVIFDENIIFIPKSHFKYNLVPDIYLVFNLAKDFSHVKFLGFFEPKLINKNNQNNDYYFIEKEKLNPVSDLKQYIENFKGNTTTGASEQDIENSERIIMAMADNDISEDEKQYLIKQLTKSAELRDKFIEYENFETLSYKAMTDPQIERNEPQEETAQTEPTDEVTDEVPSDIMQPDVEMLDSIENFDNLDLEAVNENDISFPEETPETSEADKDNLMGDLAETATTAAAAATAGTAALAGEELLNFTDTGEKVADAIDNTLDIVDSGIEIAKELVNDKTDVPEPIAFDDIDTSTLDNIPDTTDDNFEEETISFENIETAQTQNNIDYIDQIDNKISFDDIETDEPIKETDTASSQDISDTISLDDIDTSFMDEAGTISNIEDEQTISLDDLDTSNITGELEEIENNEEDVVSLDDINENDALETDISEEITNDDGIQAENTAEELPEFTQTEDIAVGNDLEDFNIEPLELQQDTDEEQSQEENTDNINFEALDNESPELPETPVTGITTNEISQEEPKSSSFGKNLLDNMAEENMNSISADDLELDETPISRNAEEITSDELLSQIDDLLNVSADTHTQESDIQTEAQPIEPQIVEETTSRTEDELDSIPDIESLVSSSETTEPAASSNTPQEVETPEENNTIATDEGLADTTLDELLNLTDDTSAENTANEDDKLGVLFNDTDPTSDTDIDNISTDENRLSTDNEQQSVPGAAFLKQKKNGNTKTLITAAALITILAGASAFVLLKPKSDTASDIETAAPAASEIINKPDQEQNNNENILETNAPTINKTAEKKIQKTKQQVKELKNTTAKKPISSESYLEVQRLVWDVPDALSYSPKIQNYLRTAGKSIKLSLSADLLLATEYAYSNQVKVGLKLSKDGNIQEANIISSSGSTEIDNIVLQSVKDTLNVVKPPSNEISTPDFNLNLIIYF